MVIELHGFPGSGKTTVLAMGAQDLLKGRSFLGIPPQKYVFTSFPCPGCYKIDPMDIGKIDISDSVILIDEISAFFDNRNYRNLDNDTMMYFKLARHYNTHLCYASQSANDADKKIRSLVSTTYIIEKFFCFTIIKPILKFHALVNGEPGERFEIGGFSTWKWCFRPRYYKYFDSYDAPELPKVEYEKWECSELVLKKGVKGLLK